MSYMHGRYGGGRGGGGGGRGSLSLRKLLMLVCILNLVTLSIQVDTSPDDRDIDANGVPYHRKFNKYFDRPSCKASILYQQKETANFTKNTDKYFMRDPITGLLLNNAENMTVTRLGCDEFCGGWSFYWDAIPRLMTWILPILLLLSNIELSPIDKKRFMMVFHALGDPIDSFWSLIHKIYIWNRLYAIGLSKSRRRMERLERMERIERAERVERIERGERTERVESGLEREYTDGVGRARVAIWGNLGVAWRRVRRALRFRSIPTGEHEALENEHQEEEENQEEEDKIKLSTHDCARIIATVLSGFEEISGAKIDSEDYYHMITRRLGRIGEEDEDPVKFEEWRKTARILADARTNEFPRTCLAVGVYIIGLVAAFIPEIGGGNTSPPGGRIASAIFLSWLVPLVLVSNTIGAFTSRRTCLTIMRQFVRRTKEPVKLTNEDAESSHQDASSVAENEHPDPEPDRDVLGRGSRNLLTRRPTAQVAPDDVSENISIHSVRVESSETDRNDGFHYPPASEWIGFKDSIDIALLDHPAHKDQTRVSWNVDDVYAPPTLELPGQDDTASLLDECHWDKYFESLQWLGSIYTYRPWKVLYLDIDHRTYAHEKNVAMAFFAFLPILISTTGAFIILWFAVPTGWNCRHIWALGIFAVWIISAIWTSGTYIRNKNEPDGHKLWVQILRKDGFIALAATCLILFSTAGLFNNCWCWSAYMMRREGAYVPLEAVKEYEDNARRIYSIVVGVCIGLQLCFFFGFMVWWRHGVKLVRWTESRRRQEWKHEMNEGLKHTDENFLLFWYEENELKKQKDNTRRLSEGHALVRGHTWQL